MAIVTDGLVLYLHGACGKNNPATRVWKDLSGNGNDGQLMNFNFTEDSGWVDGGLRFDGVDDYVTGTELRISDKANALELWVYTNSDNPQVFYATNLGLGCGINVRKEITLAAPNSKRAATFKNFIFGQWNHVVINYDQHQNPTAYFNSKPAEYGGVGNWAYRLNEYRIGAHQGGTRPLEGKIGLIRIYNRALTDEEILQNYRAGQCSPLLAMRGEVIG